jgi:chromate reductase, NAD(P)H dehydrogenase (quinone)
VPARRVGVIVGGLRKDAFSRRVADALKALQPPTLNLEIVEIRDMPFYNQDLETANPPAPWTEFRNRIRATDAVIFCTPENNRGVPAVLKNAVDAGSRPWGKSVWDNKPCGIVSSSPGPLGGFAANHQLRQNLSYFAMPILLQPEMYLGGVDKLIASGGKPADENARGLLTAYLTAFASFVERNLIRAPSA